MNPACNPRRRVRKLEALRDQDLHDHLGDRCNDIDESVDTLQATCQRLVVAITTLTDGLISMKEQMQAAHVKAEEMNLQLKRLEARRGCRA